MANNSIKFNIDFNANTSGINEAKKALEQLRDLTTKDIAIFNNTGMDEAGLKKARAMLLDIQTEAGKAEKAMETAFNQKLNTVNMQKFKEELVKSGTSLEHFKTTMSQAGPIGEKAFTEMSAGIANVKYQTIQTTTVMDKMAASLQRSLTTFISINIINKVKGSINEAYGYVKNLDTSLNEIRIVTGKSADEMDKFAEKANKAAASLGKATTDYTRASTIYYQQGLGDEEVQARTDVTLKAANTTGTDTKEVADNLTALWNGFNVGAEDAEIYVDRLAALAASTASNLDELTTAMSKTASMANVMGVSEEQLAAQIATVVSVTRQAPESVGTAFKTIYARISDISTGAEDAETTLGNYSSKLAAMGINVLDSSGKLRDMGEVIEEVGGKWGSYSKEQQVAIAGIMGGQRQVNQITALFDNWDEYTESIETMANAEGTLQKQQDVYMESAEGQLQKLRTEWEGVLDSLLSSDDIIKVAKSIQPIFESLEKVIDAFGGGIGILTKFSPLLLSLISPKISEGIAKIGMSFENTKINAEIAKSEVEGFQQQLREKAGEEAVISGYTQQIQDLINKYGELRDSMSVEQKNQFKESLKQLIENEGPKARKELEEYQKGLRAIYELDAGKDNNILKDVIKTEDKDKLDEYRKKLEELEKTLTGSSEDIKKNFGNIKKQIQDTLGDSEVGQNLIKNLEQNMKNADYSKSAKAVWDQFGEALSNGTDIDLSAVQQKVNDSFGEGNAAALTYMAGINQLQDAQKNLYQTQEELKAQNIDIAQEQEKRHEILEKTKELEEQMSHNVRLQTDERVKYNQAFKEQDEILNTYLTGEDKSIEKLKEEYEQVKNTSGAQSEKAQALQNAIEKFEEYEKVATDSMEKEEELKKELSEINHEYEEQQEKLTEVRETLAPYTNALQEVNTLTNQLSQGEVSLEEVNEQMTDTARQGADAIHDLGETVGQTANHMAEVQQQSAQTSAEVLTLGQSFEELKKINLAQNFMDIVQAGVAVYTSFQSIIGLGSIWNDEDLTTGEKLVQTFTTLATVVPILVSSVGSAATAFTALKEAEAGSAIASAVKTAALTVQAVVTKLATKEAAALTIAEIAAGAAAVPLVPLWLAIGAAVAAAAAVIAGIVIAIKAWTKANETSTERLKKANEALEEAKKKYNELNDAISDYKDAKKGLEELTEGTQEFMDAIVELNEKVLKLIETYPELAQYLEVGEHGELLLNNEGLKEYIELQKESLRLQQQSTMAEGLSTEGDKNKLKKQATKANNTTAVAGMIYNANQWINKNIGLEITGSGDEGAESAAFQYSKLLEQQEKADKAKIAAYLKSYESFAKISSNTAAAIAQDLQNKYKDNIEGLKAAMADEEAMLKRAEEYEKKAKNFANKGFDFSDADIKNEDFSNVSRADIKTIFEMDRDSLADMLGVDKASKEIDEFLNQLSMAWVEMKELPSPFENWAEDIDLGIVEKFEKDVGKIDDEILQGLGKGLNNLDKNIDIDEFTTDLANIDWSQGEEGLVEFRKKYGELTEEVERYIEAQLSTNVVWSKSLSTMQKLTSAMGTISQKKFGDMLSEKDYNKLIEKFSGLEKYFQKVGDKYEYVATNNKKVLEELKEAFREEQKELDSLNVDKLQGKSSQMRDLLDKGAIEELRSVSGVTSSALSKMDSDQLARLTGRSKEQVEKLQQTNAAVLANSGTEEAKQELEEYLAFVEDVENKQEIQKERQKEFIAAQISSLQELDAAVKDGTVSYEVAEEEREYIRNKELQSLGVTEEAYRNYLLAIGEDVSKINNTEIMIRFKMDLNGKKAFEDIDKMFADLPKKINRTEADTAVAISSLINTFKNDLDIDISSFLDENNFNLFEQMIGGDEASREQLISNFEAEIVKLSQEISDTASRGDTKTANMLDGQRSMLVAALSFLYDFQDEWGKAAAERKREIEQEISELKKASVEQARSVTQNRLGKIEDQMSHATGDNYVRLAKQRKSLQAQEVSQMQSILAFDKEILGTKKAGVRDLLDEIDGINEINKKELESLIINRGNLDVLKSTCETLGISDENLTSILEKYGEIQSAQFGIENSQQEIDDYYEKQYIDIDKSANETKRTANLQKQLNRLQEESNNLTGTAYLKNLQDQAKLRKEIKESYEDELKTKKEIYSEDKNALQSMMNEAGISFKFEFFDDGSIKNWEEFLEAINGNPIADDLLNLGNKVNDTADEMADLESNIRNLNNIYHADLSENERNEIEKNERKITENERKRRRMDPDSLEYKQSVAEDRKLKGENQQWYNRIGNEYKTERDKQKALLENRDSPLKDDLNEKIASGGIYWDEESGKYIIDEQKAGGISEDLQTAISQINSLTDNMNQAYDEAKDIAADLKGDFLKIDPYAKVTTGEERLERQNKDLERSSKELSIAEKDLSNEISDLDNEMSNLQKDQGLLYGDDLIANMEEQNDKIEEKKVKIEEQIMLQEKAIELQEKELENAKNATRLAEDRVTIAKQEVTNKQTVMVDGEEKNLSEWTTEDNFFDEKAARKALGKDAYNQNSKIIEEYKKALEDLRNAEDAVKDAELDEKEAAANLAEARRRVDDFTRKLTDAEREQLQLEKEIAQQKIKTAEDAIKRETNADHALAQALRHVEYEINQVQKAQSGLSGQKLIASLQEEMKLQQQKKKILEDQLNRIREQIKALVDLYALQLSQRFGVDVGFVVDETGVRNVDELYAALDNVDEKMRAEYMQTIQQYISTLNGMAGNLSSTTDAVDNMTDSLSDLEKKIKEEQEAELFRVKDEKWYNEEQQLKKVEKELKTVERAQKNLTGNALIQNLTQQQKILDKQVETYQRKLQLMKAELQAMQSILAMQGVMFNSDGLIANYADAFANADEKTRGYLQSYQGLYDQIADLEDQIQDTYDKKADLEIQKTQERLRMFNAKVDVELDLTKAKREWQNFKREFLNTLNGMSELNDSILENAKQNMKDIYDITTKDVVMLTDHVNKIMSEIHLMQAGGTSSLYGTDQQTALSDLNNYRQQLQDSLSSVADKMKEVEQAYAKQLEKIKNKFDDQLSNYELIQSLIEHDMNVTKILRGDNAYEDLEKFYDKATANYEQEIKFLRTQVDYWKKLMDKEVVGSERWETFQKNWKDAISKMNSAIDSALDNIVAKYDAKINAIFTKIGQKSGMTWEATKWDLEKTLKDQFLDKISTEYNLQKVQDQYIKAANDEDDPTKKQKILNLMDEQIKKYEKIADSRVRQHRLSQEEVNIMNKEYELQMLMLEAQDAANNKSQMRLRRDSSGDYRYEYVADESKLEDYKQKIKDLQEEIRLMWEEAREGAVDTYISTYETVTSKIQEITELHKQGLIDDETYKQQIDYLQNYLQQMGDITTDKYDVATENLTKATTDEMVTLGMATQEEVDKMTQKQINTLMTELYPTFGDFFFDISGMVLKVNEEVADAINEVTDLFAEMRAEIDAIGDAAGVNFDMLVAGMDEYIPQVQELIGENYDLLDQYELELNEIEALLDSLDRLRDAYQDVYDAAMDAVDAALELREAAADASDAFGTISNNITINNGGGSSSSGSIYDRYFIGATGPKRNKQTNTTIKSTETKSDITWEKGTLSAPLGEKKSDVSDNDIAKFIGIGVGVVGGIGGVEAVRKMIGRGGQLDTGGYTGEWGSKDGKLAVLHEKELVLNKDDTKNILEAVRNIRGKESSLDTGKLTTTLQNFVSEIKDLQLKMFDKFYEGIDSITQLSSTTISNNSANNLTTNNINANFPNATSMNAIEEALKNLSNATSQRLGLNRRKTMSF